MLFADSCLVRCRLSRERRSAFCSESSFHLHFSQEEEYGKRRLDAGTIGVRFRPRAEFSQDLLQLQS